MSGRIALSVLIATLPQRRESFTRLYDELLRQVGDRPIEILAFMDNRMRTIGGKMNALLESSRGDYVTFCDDDDMVAENYIDSILDATEVKPHPDVVTFKIDCRLTWKDGKKQHAIIWPSIEDQNEEFHDGIVKRKPMQIAVWDGGLARTAKWADAQYNADTQWASALWPRVRTQARINRVLYFYQWSEAGTEAK